MSYRHDKNKFYENEKPSFVERLLCRIFRVRLIEKRGLLYLRRIYLTPRWRWLPFKIFLHHIMLDDDRVCHCHPWDFSSRLLTSAYREFIQTQSFENYHGPRNAMCKERVVKAGETIHNKAEHIHRLELSTPVWSLVVAGKARRVWGFHDVFKGFVPWREYLNVPNAPDYEEDML